MSNNVTPEERTGVGVTGLPNKYTLPPPKDLNCCIGCPYPGVGFICWSKDGSCMRTDEEKISRGNKGR